MKFNSIVQLHGKTATGIEVPAEVVTSLNAGKKPPVKTLINGYTNRTSIASRGGTFLASLSAEDRTAAGVKAGDQVEVSIVLDTDPREVAIPADLEQMLSQDTQARSLFKKLSYSHQLQHVLALEKAKTFETRQRRLMQTMEMLRKK